MSAVHKLAAWRVLGAALDDTRAQLDAGNLDAARAHLAVALDARRELTGAGDALPVALRRELFALRRALASPDPRPWFGPPPTDHDKGEHHR